ncbi:hypothetical protein PCE1_001368 [Barthelona sp. PCE]
MSDSPGEIVFIDKSVASEEVTPVRNTDMHSLGNEDLDPYYNETNSNNYSKKGRYKNPKYIQQPEEEIFQVPPQPFVPNAHFFDEEDMLEVESVGEEEIMSTSLPNEFMENLIVLTPSRKNPHSVVIRNDIHYREYDDEEDVTSEEEDEGMPAVDEGFFEKSERRFKTKQVQSMRSDRIMDEKWIVNDALDRIAVEDRETAIARVAAKRKKAEKKKKKKKRSQKVHWYSGTEKNAPKRENNRGGNKKKHHISRELLEDGGFVEEKFQSFRRRVLADIKRCGPGKSYQSRFLFRFYCYFLRDEQNFNRTMYNEFKRLALNDVRSETKNDYGLQCLHRLYCYTLDKKHHKGMESDFYLSVREDLKLNSIYGLEKLRALVEYRDKDLPPLIIPGDLADRLEEYPTLDSFPQVQMAKRK